MLKRMIKEDRENYQVRCQSPSIGMIWPTLNDAVSIDIDP